jgi:hypothetical protein
VGDAWGECKDGAEGGGGAGELGEGGGGEEAISFRSILQAEEGGVMSDEKNNPLCFFEEWVAELDRQCGFEESVRLEIKTDNWHGIYGIREEKEES